ncbi:hypothetical protein NMG60_11032325 [Bertholletia excelsa]
MTQIHNPNTPFFGKPKGKVSKYTRESPKGVYNPRFSPSFLHSLSLFLHIYAYIYLQHQQEGTGMAAVFRTEMGYPYTDIEKRQLFLRSYQFSRKKTVAERIRGSFFRVKRVIWVRLRSARKIRRMLWFRIRHGLFFGFSRKNQRRFLRLNNSNNSGSWSSCFC